MITVKVENENNQILQLTNTKSFDVLDISGLTPPPATIARSAYALRSGSKHNNSKVTERPIVLTLHIKPPVAINRQLLYEHFTPNEELRLYFKTDNRDAYIDGYVETCEITIFDVKQIATISIICPDPYFKALEDILVDFVDATAQFEFPFSIPAEGVEFSTLTAGTSKLIHVGESTGLIIEMYATSTEILNPQFINHTTGEYFKVNIDLDAGQKIVINTNRGEKAITLFEADGTMSTKNLFNLIDDGSTWIQLRKGNNLLDYTCDEGSTMLNVTATTTNKFWGI